MGSVYQGVHEKSGEKVAVKLISPEVADEMRFRRRFDAEIETLKRLRHDGIVRLIGYGEEEGLLFYSMELVEGEPLQKRIRRLKRLDWKSTIDISIQVCAALKHAHDIGVIHRDLKPANLLLTQDDTVKLVDFGIAKIFGYGEQTVAGSILGTVDYMAPEQAFGDGITLRTDLYALGSVMYAMQAGRAPFKGKRITEVIDSLKREKPIPLEMVNPETPEALVELIHELLEKKPNDRPPTALAVMNRLKAMKAGLTRQQTTLGASDATSVKEASDSTPKVPDADSTQNNAVTPTINHGTVHREIPKDILGAQALDTQNPDTQNPDTEDPGDQNKTKQNTSGYDQTIVSNDLKTYKSQSDESASERKERSTHFQTVGKSPSESGIFKHNQPVANNRFVQVLSISVMGAVLLLAILLIFYSAKKPSAPELFSEIQETVAAGELSDASLLIDKFLKLFPDDEHYEDVRGMDLTLDIDAAQKRLQLKTKLPGRTLDAYEQAFLDAMQMRKTDVNEASKKLQQWLDVFIDPNTQADESKEKLGELVQFEIKRLADGDHVVESDERMSELMGRIRAGEELDESKRHKLLSGIIDLYQDESWAKTAVAIAREQIAEIDSGK